MTAGAPGRPRVVIVGGGLAGLAAASGLVDSGAEITLLESRTRLGGRACSFTDPRSGAVIDNCQHVSMGCCSNLADFCERLGIDHLFRREPVLQFLDPEGRRSTMRATPAPAPLHLSWSILRARYLSVTERLRVAYGALALRFARPEQNSEPLESWLRRHGQTDRTLRRFWETVLISALNERLDQTDVGYARKVLYEGLLGNRHGYELLIPTVPLEDLYGPPVARWLTERGVTLRMGTGVRALAVEQGQIQGVTLRTGERVAADQVILAVPVDRVRAMIPEQLLPLLPALEPIQSIETTPITGIHLWFDRPVCPVDHIALVDRPIHWVFNHTAIVGRSPEGVVQALQLVVSASYAFQSMSREAIIDLALAELRAVWPEVESATLLRSWVVTEHTATISIRPGIDRLRPPQATAVPGLTLAGDWTDTGWPSTMEGAVRSGYLAAEAVSQVLGRPARLLVPDLPSTPLARWLLGCP